MAARQGYALRTACKPLRFQASAAAGERRKSSSARSDSRNACSDSTAGRAAPHCDGDARAGQRGVAVGDDAVGGSQLVDVEF